MTLLSVPPTLDSRVLDDLTRALARGAGPLRLPVAVKTTNLLAIPQALLAVVSWSHMNGEVRTSFSFDDAPEAARKLQRNTALLVGILMSDRVVSPTGDDVTPAAHRIAMTALEEASNIPTPGSGVTLGAERAVIAADHFHGLTGPRGLYLDTPQGPDLSLKALEVYAKRSDGDITKNLWPLGWRVMGMSRVGLRHDSAFRQDAYELGKALFELFQNTHEHGRTNPVGARYDKSVRGVHVRTVSEPRHRLVASADAQRDLAEYFAAYPSGIDAVSETDRLRFLAVTVFDSGPGLAARTLWDEGLRGDATEKQELSAMLATLRKHETHDSGGLRGLGLTRVQQYLTDVGGFGMIRSGRFRLTRDFRRLPFVGAADNSNSWYGRFALPKTLTRVRGTAFTMVVPTEGGTHG